MHWFGRGCSPGRVINRRSLVSVFLVVLGVAALGCRGMTPGVKPESFTPPKGQVAFQVWTAATREGIPGVDVSGVTSEGVVSLGTTDAGGRLAVDLDSLRAIRPHVIIFCHDYFFCGALRADSPDFYEYRQHSVALAVFSID